MVIKNKLLPFKGYKALNLFGIIFTRSDLSEIDLNHEYIHTAQMKELFYIFFYLIYGIEYLFKLCKFRNRWVAYRNVSFEIEAYINQYNTSYLESRKHFSQWK